MNEDTYNDYCETESYYEEENNSDLESRLYANIHYASVENEPSDETSDTSKSCSTNTRNINDTVASNNNEQNATSMTEYTENRENIGRDLHQSVQQNKEITSDRVNKAVCTDSVEKMCNNNRDPYIFDANVEDQSTILPIRTKKRRKKKSQNDIRQQLLDFVFKTTNPLPTSSQVSNNKKNQSVNRGNKTKSSVSNVTTSNKKCTESPKQKQDTENVFMKYQKSKQSLNKVYAEKHKEIREMNTKYDVLEKKEKEKLQDIEHSNNVKDVDSDSDSDQSILEVPVPPKPEPPLINLNDSDEDIDSINNDNTITKQPLTIDNCNTADFKNQVKRALSKSQSELIFIDDSETLDDSNTTEDIILNCTDIQKGASSINEIREMRKDAQKKKKSNATKEKNSDVLQECINVDNNKSKSKRKIADTDSASLSNKNRRRLDKVTTKETNNSIGPTGYIGYNDSETYLGNTNVDFTEDVFPADAFIRSQNELNANKKRQLEHQHKVNDKVKRKKNNNEPCQSKASTSSTHNKTQGNTDKSIDDSFFDPMPDKLKAFYTDSRGQENFDVNEVQSKMSKDPQLWAILDEDLRPSCGKQRFWNIRCTHCQQKGHQRSNCPEPRRTPKCYMCGVEGHTEVRCPQKMCLTCGKRQGTFRKTCETCRTFYCTMCNAVGHQYTECPDLWRRYHQTTTTDNVSLPGKKDAMKPANLLVCCNCTRRGHDSSTCKDYRWSQHFPTPPFVSNYTDGPTYMEEQTKNMDVLSDVQIVQFHDSANGGINNVPRSDDLLPFPKELLKTIQTRKKAFPQQIPQLAWETERNVSYVIYQCGDFYTLEKNGMEMRCTITARKGFNTYNIMECRVVPNFLEKLLELFRFEVKIYKEIRTSNEIVLRIRTFSNLISDLRRFILYWLSLEDDEKDYVVFLNLPRERTAMLNILNLAIKKLGTETGNAHQMYEYIVALKEQLPTTRDEKKYGIMLSQIQETQYKLLLILNDHPNLHKIPDEMRALVTCLERSTSEDIPIQAYLQILTIYNFLFVPHTPPKSFITKYGKKYKPPVVLRKNVQKQNPNSTAPNVQTKVQHNSTIPVIITNRTDSRNNSKICESIEANSANENFTNMSNTGRQVCMPQPQATVSSRHVRFNNNIDQMNISSETAMDQSEDFSDDFILNRNIVQYDTVSSLHDFLPIDTASEKYTNITVNVSNKDKVHATESLKSSINNSRNDESQNINKCTNITLNVSNKNRTDTANPKLNMDNSKNDKCQDTNKYTNIIVSVSNKDQANTTTSFQSNSNNSKNNKHQNSNKYTNITVSVSDKNQTHTAVSTVSNGNEPTTYNLQKNDTNNSKNNCYGDDNDVVCIEINKEAQNPAGIQEQNQKQNGNKNKKKKILLTMAQKQEKRANRMINNANRETEFAKKIRLRLIQLNQTINKHIGICSTNNINSWKDLSRMIMEGVSVCHVPLLKKAAKALKNKIHQNILSKEDVYMFQQLVVIELQHHDQLNKVYNNYKTKEIKKC